MPAADYAIFDKLPLYPNEGVEVHLRTHPLLHSLHGSRPTDASEDRIMARISP
jgi:hypothetical protein